MKDTSPRRLPGVARVLDWMEARFSTLFRPEHNPFHHLGALTVYCFWIALVTGLYLFIFYETSLVGAWTSVERITHEQWYAGGIMRSLHRYASAAAVLFMVLHLLREFVRGRYRGPRWFSWFTGIPLVWIVIIFGISGYWMVWDELAQYIAISTARLLDWLPIFSDPMSRTFLTNDSVSNRFFTLVAFIHLVGLPIILVLGIWFHLLRIRLPRINPPRALMAGSLGAMLVLSLVLPALSHPPADLDEVPRNLNIDWFYLAVFPLLSVTSEAVVWATVVGSSILLSALPWLLPVPKPAVAEVHLPDCTGCGYCAEDCPYGAIDMVPRTDGRNFDVQARVDPSLCVGCGICTGSCPSSSPFRHREPLTTGIDLPSYSMDRIKSGLIIGNQEQGNQEQGNQGSVPRLLVVGCDCSIAVERLDLPDVRTLSLPCTGMLPPAAIDYALRSAGYAGVVVTGCDNGDCYHRYGDHWTRSRIDRERMPTLRSRVPRQHLKVSWLKPTETDRLRAEIDAFRRNLARDRGSETERETGA